MTSQRIPLLCILSFTFAFGRLQSAETLPNQRPALVGSGPNSLVNLIDAQRLFAKGQRDAWVTFECGIAGDGFAGRTEFFTVSPDAELLKNEVWKRLRQARFLPPVYNHRRTSGWFSGTVVFVVANGKPHVRVYASQELDEIKRGADFIAPQLIFVPGHEFIPGIPDYPSIAYHGSTGGVVRLRHSVDANGKTIDIQVISEKPVGYHFGEIAAKTARLLDYLPAYRNGQPTAASYTLTWWFGRPTRW